MKTNHHKHTAFRAALLTACALTATAFPMGSAWATEIPDKWNPRVEGDKLTIDTDATLTNSANYEFGGKKISDYNEVVVNFNPTGGGQRPIGVYSERFDWDNVNLTVNVTGNYSNNDALHFSNFDPHINLKSLTINQQAAGSDAINFSRDIAGDAKLHLAYDVTATVRDGNGIRANASTKGNSDNPYVTSITIDGNTNINIETNAGTLLDALKGKQVALCPTAIWAGSDVDFRERQQAVGKGEIYLKNATNITLEGKGNYGLSAGKNGYIEANDLYIYSSGSNSFGVNASNINISYSTLDFSKNLFAGEVVLNGKNNTIEMEGDNSYAIYAKNTDINGNSNTVKSGDDGIGYIYFIGDVMAESGGLIDLHVTGDTTGTVNLLKGDVKAYGTEKEKGAAVNLTVDNALSGEGTLAAANGGTVNLSLGAYSNWTGRADDYGDANNKGSSSHATSFIDPEFDDITSGGAVNLTMGNDAVWNVDGQSWITNLTASGDNMFINLLGTEADRNANADALTIYNLKGHATFAMHLDGERSGSDMLYIRNTDGSSYDVYLDELVTAEDMYQNGAFKDGLRFATVGKGDVTFNVYSLNQGIYNLKYQVEQKKYEADEEKINDAYNESNEKPGSDMVEDFFTSGGEPPSTQSAGLTTQEQEGQNAVPAWNYNLVAVQDRQITDAGKTIIAMSKVNYSNAVYMDRLNKRMGEARYIDGDDGLWVRMRHDRIGKEDAFRSMNTMFELGYDWHAKGQKDGEHRQGVAFDYMRGTADYKNVAGDGDVRRAGVWLYDTWLGDKGHYSDYVVKYGRLSNDFDIYALSKPGEKISGDYDNDAWSVSAEYGRKKDLGNDWYIEPQAQLQYAYVTDASYTTNQGTKVSLDSIDSLIGRAGFRLGRDTDEANTVYFKADILHEFLGGQSIRAMDSTGTLSATYENGGTWYDVGFGFSHRMSEDKYMFLDVEKLFGNDNEDTYQVNIGLNMAF